MRTWRSLCSPLCERAPLRSVPFRSVPFSFVSFRFERAFRAQRAQSLREIGSHRHTESDTQNTCSLCALEQLKQLLPQSGNYWLQKRVWRLRERERVSERAASKFNLRFEFGLSATPTRRQRRADGPKALSGGGSCKVSADADELIAARNYRACGS